MASLAIGPRQMSFLPEVWLEVRDGNDSARSIFDQHYSRYRYADGRKPKIFVGPGSKLVLISPCARALFIWRKFISRDRQEGVNCAVFRNEGAGLSSSLIVEAMRLARGKWPEERRLYTYVHPPKIRSTKPGYCFLVVGWKHAGYTKCHRHRILEYVEEGKGKTDEKRT